MKEALFIFLVLLVLAGLTAYRYRRGIRTALEFWRMVKTARNAAPRPAGKPIREEPAAAGALVNCQKCGKWVSENVAVRLGRKSFYCSTRCLEASSKPA